MRKANGMTIVEILISVVIISLVLALLFSLLIQVRQEENENAIQSNFLLNQTTFIKQIEEDITNYGVKAVSTCELGDTGVTNVSIVQGYESNYKCVRLDYASDYARDNVGFITIYYTYQSYEYVNDVLKGKDPVWSVSYQRGSYKQCQAKNPVKDTWSPNGGKLMRTLPSEVDLSEKPYVKYTAYSGANSTNAASIVIPIVNLEGEHYDINLSFIFTGNDNFVCNDGERLQCKCDHNTDLCNATKTTSGLPKALTNIQKLKNHLCS